MMQTSVHCIDARLYSPEESAVDSWKPKSIRMTLVKNFHGTGKALAIYTVLDVDTPF